LKYEVERSGVAEIKGGISESSESERKMQAAWHQPKRLKWLKAKADGESSASERQLTSKLA